MDACVSRNAKSEFTLTELPLKNSLLRRKFVSIKKVKTTSVPKASAM